MSREGHRETHAEREAREHEEREERRRRRALKPGEWACVDAKCAHINSERRTVCDACGKAKPRAKSRVGKEIGKDAADKSKGLFSADDWVCSKCGNVNWARRSVCNVCNAPKLADREVRTGYGGGYMDREDVEYIDREDDSEYDEFGRKKKKKAGEHRENRERPSADARKSQDEEDDEGDGDDRKYRLLDDDDEEVCTMKQQILSVLIRECGRPPEP
ncbi:Protein Y25C1A.8 a [Aphelenchoides avenae]|nr:Protein Y25C1A.8 a [Aphelenchus avenae]